MTERAGKSARQRRRKLIRMADAQDNLCFHCLLPMILPEPGVKYENNSRQDDDIASFDHFVL